MVRRYVISLCVLERLSSKSLVVLQARISITARSKWSLQHTWSHPEASEGGVAATGGVAGEEGSEVAETEEEEEEEEEGEEALGVGGSPTSLLLMETGSARILGRSCKLKF